MSAMGERPPFPPVDDARTTCTCGHSERVHSMFGCLTCARERPEECLRFVSKAAVDLLATGLRDVARAAVDRGVRVMTLPELDRVPPAAPAGWKFEYKPLEQPAVESTFTEGGHEFRQRATDERGIHSGRVRYHVECMTCGELVHEATTGPREMANSHVREFNARSRGQ